MATIEPSSFDVIVLGSGLVECLIGSALTRAGKSVLLLDQTDVYGSDFASFTVGGLLGSTDPSINPNVGPTEESHEVTLAQALPAGVHAVPVPRPGLPIADVETWEVPGCSVGNDRSFILDLAPKVMYQGEELVDVLVRTRAHNYLEFKAVDGCYMLHGSPPSLARVPACRADVFKDRQLGLGDKRHLMAFISAAMDGVQGLGRLKGPLASDQPLAQLVTSEGLSPHLGAIVMYGIATAWASQHPATTPHAQDAGATTTARAATVGATTTAGAATAGAATAGATTTGVVDSGSQPEAATASTTSTCTSTDTGPTPPPPPPPPALPAPFSGQLTAAQGGAALSLFTASISRFGAPGAFMAPSYGCGSVAEALVRHCAVHGAVTALRHPVGAILVGPRTAPVIPATQREAEAEAAPQPAVEASGSAGGAATVVADAADAADAATGGSGAAEPGAAEGVNRSGAGDGLSAAPAATESADSHAGGASSGGGSESDSTAPVVRGILCRSGQVLECREALVASARTLSGLLSNPSPPTPTAPAPHTSTTTTTPSTTAPTTPNLTLARCIAVLDGPLRPGEAMSTLVIPPHTPGLGNPHPIQGLLLGPSAQTSPQGRWLLYLSTPTAPTASNTPAITPGALLLPALSQLAQTAGLKGPDSDMGPGAASQPGDGSDTGPAPTTADGREEGAAGIQPQPSQAQAQGGAQAAPAKTGAGAPQPKPLVLRVHFYHQGLCCPSPLPAHPAVEGLLQEPQQRRQQQEQEPLQRGQGQVQRQEQQGSPLQPEGVPLQPSTAATTTTTTLPPNVVCCPGPDPSLMGYVAAVSQARALLRAHFPAVTWLGDLPRPGEGGEEEGGARGGGEDEDEIDDLAAALAKLEAVAHQDQD